MFRKSKPRKSSVLLCKRVNFGLIKCGGRDNPAADRMSDLPDEILIFILSNLLTFAEAARTSVLSSRWKDLWLHTASLDFDGTHKLDKINHRKVLEQEREKYVQQVNRILQCHNGLTLDKFRIRFDLDNSCQNVIDQWLEYAFKRHVKRLDLDLSKEYLFIVREFASCYTLPKEVLVENTRQVQSLKELCFKSVSVSGEVLEFILQNCPLLERLSVDGSGDLVSLNVSGPSLMLRQLEIKNCFRKECITIRNTNLVSLEISQPEHLVLQNVPLLAEVSVRGSSLSDFFSRFSCCLSQLEVLVFRFSDPEENMGLLEFPVLTKLRKLVMTMKSSESISLMAYTSLLYACPHLEELVLQLRTQEYARRNHRQLQEPVKCPLKYLKFIQLQGYYGYGSELELLVFLVKNAVSLEKIIINPCSCLSCCRKPEHIEREEEVRSYALQQLKGKFGIPVELGIL